MSRYDHRLGYPPVLAAIEPLDPLPARPRQIPELFKRSPREQELERALDEHETHREGGPRPEPPLEEAPRNSKLACIYADAEKRDPLIANLVWARWSEDDTVTTPARRRACAEQLAAIEALPKPSTRAGARAAVYGGAHPADVAGLRDYAVAGGGGGTGLRDYGAVVVGGPRAGKTTHQLALTNELARNGHRVLLLKSLNKVEEDLEVAVTGRTEVDLTLIGCEPAVLNAILAAPAERSGSLTIDPRGATLYGLTLEGLAAAVHPAGLGVAQLSHLPTNTTFNLEVLR